MLNRWPAPESMPHRFAPGIGWQGGRRVGVPGDPPGKVNVIAAAGFLQEDGDAVTLTGRQRDRLETSRIPAVGFLERGAAAVRSTVRRRVLSRIGSGGVPPAVSLVQNSEPSSLRRKKV